MKKLIFSIAAISLFALLAQFNYAPKHNSDNSATNDPNPVLIKDIYPEDVLTWDCESPIYKPTTIMLTCGDGGWAVIKIKWQTWTTEEATGKGYFRENLCQPSCAEGEIVQAPVLLKLSSLTPYKEKFYFRTLDITTPDGKPFPWGRSGIFQWDVMEFAEMMNENS